MFYCFYKIILKNTRKCETSQPCLHTLIFSSYSSPSWTFCCILSQASIFWMPFPCNQVYCVLRFFNKWIKYSYGSQHLMPVVIQYAFIKNDTMFIQYLNIYICFHCKLFFSAIYIIPNAAKFNYALVSLFFFYQLLFSCFM